MMRLITNCIYAKTTPAIVIVESAMREAMRNQPTNQPVVRVIDYHNTLGRINYETFCRSQGSSPADWSKMSQEQQAAWYQGAIAVVETVWREKHPEVVNT